MKKEKRFHLSLRVLLALIVILTMWFTDVVILVILYLSDRYFGFLSVMPKTIWSIVLGTAIVSVLMAFLSKWIFKPISQLGSAMQEVANGNFHVQLDETQRFKEIGRIFANFNQMVGALRSTEILQTDFVSNVSHEFKTPINAIEGYATLLQSDSLPSSPENAEYVDRILFNTHRLSKLVSNILLLSKVDNQAIETQKTSFRLDEQIRQSIVMLEPEWEKKDLYFDVNLESISFVGNETLLIHVWDNLLSNAVKFTPPCSTIRICLKRDRDEIVCTVDDEGPGISPDEQNHVFEKFYQSDGSHKAEGNGLGLALVKQILTISGGSIAVENLPEAGCRFSVFLPAHPAS